MHPKNIEALSHDIYDGALDASLWLETIQSCAEAFSGVGTVILQPGLASPLLYVSSGLEHAAKSYNEYWWQEDIVLSTAQRLGLVRPGIVWDHLFLSNDIKAKSFYFQDFLRTHDIGDIATVIGALNGKTKFAINVQRRLGVAPPDEAEQQSFATVSRHLSRALAIRLELASSQAIGFALSQRLAEFDCAVAILDRTGQAKTWNKAFDTLSEDGVHIRNGSVQLASGTAQTQFELLVRSVATGLPAQQMPDALFVPRPNSLLPLIVRVTPLRGQTCERLGSFTPVHGALLMILKPDNRAYPDLSNILVRLGLTQAQTRVALLIAAGHTTKTAAEYLAVSDETVRSHLKAAYTRLGIDRQADLVRLVGKVVPFET